MGEAEVQTAAGGQETGPDVGGAGQGCQDELSAGTSMANSEPTPLSAAGPDLAPALPA
jgi:hypothetical protein